MGKRLNKKTCYSCEKIVTSREHVPPQCIFEEPFPSNLITVPSCDQHNSKKSKDDEYFRWFIATASSENKKARNLIRTKVIRGFRRRPALLHEIWKGAIKHVSVSSHGGVYLGDKPGFKFNRLRIQKIMNQICKGLFYHHFTRKLPDKYRFHDFIIYPKINSETKKLICSCKLYNIGDGTIFSYRQMVCSEDPNFIIWALMFFSSFLIMCRSKRPEE